MIEYEPIKTSIVTASKSGSIGKRVVWKCIGKYGTQGTEVFYFFTKPKMIVGEVLEGVTDRDHYTKHSYRVWDIKENGFLYIEMGIY